MYSGEGEKLPQVAGVGLKRQGGEAALAREMLKPGSGDAREIVVGRRKRRRGASNQGSGGGARHLATMVRGALTID